MVWEYFSMAVSWARDFDLESDSWRRSRKLDPAYDWKSIGKSGEGAWLAWDNARDAITYLDNAMASADQYGWELAAVHPNWHNPGGDVSAIYLFKRPKA